MDEDMRCEAVRLMENSRVCKINCQLKAVGVDAIMIAAGWAFPEEVKIVNKSYALRNKGAN